MDKPLAIDLYCGLGGWAEGFLAENFDVIGFDIERHDYGTGGYPAQLVLQDVRTIHGSQFRDAAVIVASPPCQKYSYMAMPWKRAKALAAWYREDSSRQVELNELFNACFRIQREASEAAGRHIPLIVENVKGAEKWVGRARWHHGSFYLWGDTPALMPTTLGRKNSGGSWFAVAPHNKERGQNPDGRKLPGNNAPRMWSERRIQRLADANRDSSSDFYLAPSSSNRRKAASAHIAKIPFPLANHIAKCFYPRVLSSSA
jgi:C-5 cytosine-specific DNA methylase